MKLFLIPLLAVLLGACQGMTGAGMPGNIFQTDSSVTTSVQTALAGNPQVAGVPIKVDAANGRVQLSGYVKTIRQSDVAADVAGKVKGVKAVDNNLIVRK